MLKYEIRINVKPQIHNGFMQHYWQIIMICEDGIFTIKHGWNKHISDAALNAASAATSLQLNW